MATTTTQPPHVVILGGSYGGLSTLQALLSIDKTSSPSLTSSSASSQIRPCCTLIDERDGFYHLVGAPLGQISLPHARDFWIPYHEIMNDLRAAQNLTPAECRFEQAMVSKVDMLSKTVEFRPHGVEGVQRLEYDYLVVATGRRWGKPVVPLAVQRERYLEEVQTWEARVEPCRRVVVVGGGACGIELAGEIKSHWPDKNVVLVHSGATLLNREPLTDEFKAIALQLLQTQGVDVRLNTRLIDESVPDGSHEKHRLTLSGGEVLDCDLVIRSAVQQGANSGFLPSQALDEDGSVRVRDTLQFPADVVPHADVHFAIGDVARFAAIKRSVPAMGMGRHVAVNILTAMTAVEQRQQPATLKDLERPTMPGMTLAVGEYAMSNRQGIMYGKDLKLRAFGTGLGIDGTLSNLGLRPRKRAMV